MDTSQNSPHARLGLIIPLALAIIIADQLSKAWFVFKLGTHHASTFAEFAAGYFSLWGANGGGAAVTAHYFPFKTGIHVWAPWIEFNLTTNTGAAWSMFTGNSFVLSGVSLLMAALLAYVWWRSFRTHLAMTWALGGIIGGALGNFIDRFRLKEVVDFIDVRIPWIGRIFPHMGDPYDFPIFNVADSCAVIGTLALALYLIVADFRAIRRKRQLAMHGSDEDHLPGFPPTHEYDQQLPGDKPQAGLPSEAEHPNGGMLGSAPPAAHEMSADPPATEAEPAAVDNGEEDGSQRP
jgi:signal peptidase II